MNDEEEVIGEEPQYWCNYCKDPIEPEELKKSRKKYYHKFCYEQKNGRSELHF